jgi:hypothetical protein
MRNTSDIKFERAPSNKAELPDSELGEPIE